MAEKYGLLEGIPDVGKIRKQIQNSDHEHTVLRRFPFHEAHTESATLQQYSLAIRYLFEVVPDRFWTDVTGRLNRKLVKRMQHFKTHLRK